MILATVGLHYQPFDRFVQMVDRVALALDAEVLVQYGASRARPAHCEGKAYFDENEFTRLVKQSALIIGHAGAGTVIDALRNEKPIVLVPRRREFRECMCRTSTSRSRRSGQRKA